MATRIMAFETSAAHEPAPACHPSEGPLNDPTARQHLEALGTVAATDDLDDEVEIGRLVHQLEAVISFTRSNGQTIYHPVGTRRMGSRADAVVDSRLKVRGITGVRVVDASIMPTQISGNTMAAVLMIAEKASDLIREDQK